MINSIIVNNHQDCRPLQLALNKCSIKSEIFNSEGSNLLSFIKSKDPHLIFLNVDDQKTNVFDTVRKLKQTNSKVGLVIVSESEKYALRAIQNDIFDYLLLPINELDVQRVYGRYLQKLKSENSHIPKIPFPNAVKVSYIEPDRILYCKSDGNYSWIVDQQDKIHSNYKLKQIEENLDNNQFVRVHKQFIINIHKIKEYHKREGGFIIMENDDKIPISRTKKVNLLTKIKLA